jgi:hypothetical protein
MIDPGEPGVLTSVACPSDTECVAVGHGGGNAEWFTFNPAFPGSPTPTVIAPGQGSVGDVACPSTTECTASTPGVGIVTFDPTSPSTPTPIGITRDGQPVGVQVACPSITQCTVFYGGSRANKTTFDPAAPGNPTPTFIADEYPYILYGSDALACPSRTQCTAVGYSSPGGVELTFDPTVPARAGFTVAPSVSTDTVSVELACTGLLGQSCTDTIVARTTERLAAKGNTVVAVSAKTAAHSRARIVTVGEASFAASLGQTRTVKLGLNVTGRRLVRRFKRLPAKLTITTAAATGKQTTVATKTITFTSQKAKV